MPVSAQPKTGSHSRRKCGKKEGGSGLDPSGVHGARSCFANRDDTLLPLRQLLDALGGVFQGADGAGFDPGLIGLEAGQLCLHHREAAAQV